MRFARIAAFLVVGALACTSLAVAAKPKGGQWKGTKLAGGQNLKFKVKKGKIKSISANVLEYCSGTSYSTWTTFAPDGSWKIKKNGKFSGRKKEKYGAVTAYFTFKGKFTSKGKARGILRSETRVGGSVCDTYERKWKAKKG